MFAHPSWSKPFVRAVALAAAITALHGGVSAQAAKRPNFLFIITDDQDPFTLDCYGDNQCDTPNLDRLAREGMVIVDAHHMGAYVGAVCTPSRTMVMTGRTVWHLPFARGPRGFQPTIDAKTAAENSLPAVFNRAGYVTFRTCKRGNSFEPANALFQIRHDATKRGPTHENGSPWHGDRVMEFLTDRARQPAEQRKPFLIYFGFSHPHDPRNAPPELAAKYGASNAGPPERPNPKSPPLPPNWLPAHPFHHGHPNLRDEVAVQGVGTRRDPATIRNERGRYYGCIENIDRQVGRVLKQLQEMGELDNTYVFFTSDHGIAVGRHGLQGKQNLYEHTWRVPFIARGPGIKPGSRASGFIYLLDVLPTLCDLAGIPIPETVQGKSFRDVLEGRRERIRDVLYGVYCGGTKPGMRSVKTADGWKLIKYDVLNGEVQRTQLFNLNDNPLEWLAEHREPSVAQLTGARPSPQQSNLADDPRFAAKRKDLEALLLAEMRRLGDPYRLWDQPQDGFDREAALKEVPKNRGKKKPKQPRKKKPAGQQSKAGAPSPPGNGTAATAPSRP